jgi:hypothetical protein
MKNELVKEYYENANDLVRVFIFDSYVFIDDEGLELRCKYCISNKNDILKEYGVDTKLFKKEKYKGKSFEELYQIFKMNEYFKPNFQNKTHLGKISVESFERNMRELIEH